MGKTKRAEGVTEAVRRYVYEHYVRQAKRTGRRKFEVTVGDVHRSMGLQNRVPLVCHALSSKKFLEENSLKIVRRLGPPSGQSTTVALTYEFEDNRSVTPFEALRALRGAGKVTFAELGGGERFLRSERQAFNKTMDQRERLS